MRSLRVLRRLSPLLLAGTVLLFPGQAPVVAAASETLWKSVPLDGGAVVGLGVGTDPATVWAMTPYAGVFRSLDGGSTWTRSQTAPSPRALLAGADPRNGDRVFVMFLHPQSGDYTQLGLFFTTDGGATWTRSRQGLGANAFVYQVAFDPDDEGVVYAAASTGLHRSQDGGRTWARLGGIGESVYAVGVAPDDPRLLLLSTLDRVYRSTDGGATFTEVFRSGIYYSFVFDPHDPSRIYGTGGPLFRSTDRGLTWEQIGRKYPVGFQSVAVDGDGTLYAGSSLGVLRSTDGGTTFTPPSAPGLNGRRPDDSILAIAPLANSDVLAAGLRGVWRLADGESAWRASSRGIRGFDITGLAVTAGGRLLLSVPYNGVFRSDDGGKGFRSSAQGLRNQYGVPGLHLVPSPSSPQIVYGGDGSREIFRSNDGGVFWHKLTVPNPAPLVDVLAVHPTRPNLVFAGGEEYNPRDDYGKCHALRSEDGGATWDCLEGNSLYTLSALAFDPQRPGRMYGLDYEHFLISDDDGLTWHEGGRGLPSSNSYAVTVAVNSRGRVLIGTANGRVMRSVDGGESFVQISRNLPNDSIRRLLVDPRREDTLFAVFDQQGIYRSRDGGVRWERLTAGLPLVRFNGVVALDAERGLLFAGTSGRGLFVLNVR